MSEGQTPETVRVEDVDANSIKPIEAPVLYASTLQAVWTGNDCSIIFSRPRPAHIVVNGQGMTASLQEPVAIMQLSPQTAKDLLLLLSDTVGKFEAEFGVIVTEYSRGKAGNRK